MEETLENENYQFTERDKKIAPIINVLFVGALIGGCSTLQAMGITPEDTEIKTNLTEEEQELGLSKTHHAIVKKTGEHFVSEDEYMPLESLEGYTYVNINGLNGFINTEDVVVDEYVDKSNGTISYPVTGTPISKLNITEKVLCKRL